MLWMIAVVLLVLWLLGLVSGFTMGGFIHVLLVLAIVVLIRGIRGRKSSEPDSAFMFDRTSSSGERGPS